MLTCSYIDWCCWNVQTPSVMVIGGGHRGGSSPPPSATHHLRVSAILASRSSASPQAAVNCHWDASKGKKPSLLKSPVLKAELVSAWNLQPVQPLEPRDTKFMRISQCVYVSCQPHNQLSQTLLLVYHRLLWKTGCQVARPYWMHTMWQGHNLKTLIFMHGKFYDNISW